MLSWEAAISTLALEKLKRGRGAVREGSRCMSWVARMGRISVRSTRQGTLGGEKRQWLRIQVQIDGYAEDRKEISLVGVKDCVGDGHTVNNYSDLDYRRF